MSQSSEIILIQLEKTGFECGSEWGMKIAAFFEWKPSTGWKNLQMNWGTVSSFDEGIWSTDETPAVFFQFYVVFWPFFWSVDSNLFLFFGQISDVDSLYSIRVHTATSLQHIIAPSHDHNRVGTLNTSTSKDQ